MTAGLPPGATQPGATQPGATQPGATQPRATQPAEGATVAICRYGAGNVRSVELALTRLGCEVDTSWDADVAGADLVVLPGVGSARSAMGGLRARGLDAILKHRLTAGRPVLGICLGLQLALDWTDEDGGVPGLGLIPGRAVRLSSGRVPRMGWAPLDHPSAGLSSDVQPGNRDMQAAYGEELTMSSRTYYYAHSYAADSPATTQWSEGVPVELRRGSFVGCQFHPEKSGAAGARYLAELLAGWGLRASAQPTDAHPAGMRPAAALRANTQRADALLASTRPAAALLASSPPTEESLCRSLA